MATRPEIRALTGLRALAALWVVLFHIGLAWPVAVPLQSYAFYRRGYLGVDLFFVLSGFVLFYNYGDRVVLGASTLRQYGAFLWRRLARIYPIHIATMVAWMIAASLHPEIPVDWDPFGVLCNVLMVHSWGWLPEWQLNAPSWSISAEWFAYLAFPLLVWAARVRSALGALYGALAAYLLFGVAVGGWLAVPDLEGASAFEFTLERIGFQFVAGMLLCVAHQHLSASRAFYGLDLLALAAIVGLIELGASDFVVVPMFGLLVLALASGRGVLTAALSTRVLRFWGRVSYSLYMTHVLFIRIVNRTMYELSVGATEAERWLLFFGRIAATLLVAVLFYALIEKPARRLLAGRRSVRDAPAAGQASEPS